jgi:hypothetical protein
MVLSDWPSTPWLETGAFVFEILSIKLLQLERRLYFKTYWAFPSQMAMPRNSRAFPERIQCIRCE